MLFVAGLAMLLVSVRLVDLALPEAADAAALEEHSDWRSRKWVMFGVGSLDALVTMSVSVALTVLVPAVAKGYFRRRQVMPYIMGANITTLGDTLLTAFLVGNPVAVHVVLAELVCIAVVTFLLLAFCYPQLQDRVTRFADWVLDERHRLAGFVAVLFVAPLTLIFLF
jgi:sodium-dependent phosphate cotransporter